MFVVNEDKPVRLPRHNKRTLHQTQPYMQTTKKKVRQLNGSLCSHLNVTLTLLHQS